MLSGDCGGTNTRLVLFSVPEGVTAERGKIPTGEVLLSKHYRNAENTSFTACCEAFLTLPPVVPLLPYRFRITDSV